MKIAILVGGLPPHVMGGTEVATWNLAKQLARLGHEIHIITKIHPGLQSYSINDDIHIHRMNSHSDLRIIWPAIYWWKIFRLLKTIAPEFIQCQGHFPGLSAFFYKKIFHTPYFIWGRGVEIYDNSRLERFIFMPVMKTADGVIALTEDMRMTFQQIWKVRAVVISNGIETEVFQDLPRNKDVLKKKHLIYIGRLEPVKGVEILIDMMLEIHDTNPDMQLLIIGDGSLKKRLEDTVLNKGLTTSITLLGKISHDEIPGYLVNADIFVLPSLAEGFPNVILEAMAAGLPVVATRVGGVCEIVEEGVNGYLIDVRDPYTMANRINVLIQDHGLYQSISENNLRKAELYTWENVTKKLVSLYENYRRSTS